MTDPIGSYSRVVESAVYHAIWNFKPTSFAVMGSSWANCPTLFPPPTLLISFLFKCFVAFRLHMSLPSFLSCTFPPQISYSNNFVALCPRLSPPVSPISYPKVFVALRQVLGSEAVPDDAVDTWESVIKIYGDVQVALYDSVAAGLKCAIFSFLSFHRL